MAWERWIENYGYVAVFLGCLLEGETVLTLAGYSISRGYLDPLPTFLLAAAGCALGDFVYYWLGRRYGSRLIRQWRYLRPLRSRATVILRRWGGATAFFTRFAYGLRIILPMSLGAARLRLPVFLLYNWAASACFAAIYLTLGYLFGTAIQEMLDRVRPYERWIVLSIILLGATIWAVREWWLYRKPLPPTPLGAEPPEPPATPSDPR
jgi:membrane protein DedA with SNARE-associated domain